MFGHGRIEKPAVYIRSQSIVAWFLTAWFAALVGVNEGWHLVPGNGHWVETTGGHGVYVGIRGIDLSSAIPCEDPSLGQEKPDQGTVKSEADCAICRLSGQQKLLRWSLDGELSSLVYLSTPCLSQWVIWIRASQSLHSRAPPRI